MFTYLADISKIIINKFVSCAANEYCCINQEIYCIKPDDDMLDLNI